MAERSARRYRAIAAEFVAMAGADTLLSETTRDTVSGYRDERLQTHGKSKKTVDLEITALRSMFRYGVDRMGMKENPADGVMVTRTKAERNREARAGRRRMPTHEEADRLCTAFLAIRAYSVGDSQDCALFARYAGMPGRDRPAPCRRCRAVPGEDGSGIRTAQPGPVRQPYAPGGPVPEGMALCLFVRDAGDRSTKTGLERVVPVAAKLLPTVDRRLDSASGTTGALFLFALADRGAVFGRAWLKNAKRVHPELTLHGFRHYAASEMENNGANRSISNAVLGHVDDSVHGGYVHVTVGAMGEAVEKIG
jgi:integrase